MKTLLVIVMAGVMLAFGFVSDTAAADVCREELGRSCVTLSDLRRYDTRADNYETRVQYRTMAEYNAATFRAERTRYVGIAGSFAGQSSRATAAQRSAPYQGLADFFSLARASKGPAPAQRPYNGRR